MQGDNRPAGKCPSRKNWPFAEYHEPRRKQRMSSVSGLVFRLFVRSCLVNGWTLDWQQVILSH